MSSVKQVTANQANAKLSTGPKTEGGKRKSRMNAVKHGLSAQTIVVGDEDPADFEALRENLEQDFQPETYLERELVQRLAIYTLRLRRIPAFEAAYMQFFERFAREKAERNSIFDPLERLSQSVLERGKYPTVARMASWLSRSDDFQNALAKLTRHEAFLLNAFNRTLQQLLFFRAARSKHDKLLPRPQPDSASESDDDESS